MFLNKDAINRRLYKRLIIVETAIHRVSCQPNSIGMDAIAFIDLAIAFIDLAIAFVISVVAFIDLAIAFVILAMAFIDLAFAFIDFMITVADCTCSQTTNRYDK